MKKIKNKKSILISLFILFFYLSINIPESYSFNNNTIDTLKALKYYNRAKFFNNKSKYDSSYYYFNLSAKIYKKSHKWQSYIMCLINISDYYRIKSNFSKAAKILSKAEKYSNTFLKQNNIIFSDLLHLKGTINGDKGNFDEAIKEIIKSIELKIKVKGPNDTTLANSYNNLGTYYFYLAKYDKASDYYKKALNIALKKRNKENSDIAMYYQNIGIIYAKKGDFEKAMKFFNKNLSINKKILSKDDPNLALIYLNIGKLYVILSKYNKAIEYNNKAEDIYIKKFGDNYKKLGSIYMNKGTIYNSISDYEKALIYYNKALSIFKENLKPDHPEILKVYMNIGYVYKKKCEYKKALYYYKKSIPKIKNSPSIIKTYRNFANCYKAIGNTKKANYYYNLSINKAIKILGNNNSQLALNYLYYGDFCAHNGKKEKGIKLLKKSYKIYYHNFGLKNRDVSNCLTYIGNFYSLQKDYKKALEYYQKSLISIVKDFKDTNVYKNPNIKNIVPDYYLLNALNNKANALYQYFANKTHNKKDIETSLKTYELAIRLIEKMRSEYLNEESKLLLTEKERKSFPNAIKTALILYNKTKDRIYLEKAFEYAEKSKSAILLASIRDIEAKQLGGIPKKIQIAENDLKRKLSIYNKFVYEEKQKQKPDQSKIALWENKLFELNKKYDSTISTIEKQYPKYYHLKYDYTVVDDRTIQNSLNQKQALIEYTVTDTLLFTFVITKNKFKVFTQTIDTTFNNNIKQIRNELISKDYANYSLKDYKIFTSTAYNLYLKLIKPEKNIIKGKKLIIVPDDKLGYIPFGILLSKLPNNFTMNYRYLSYLLKKYSISYSYSATLLFNNLYKNKIPPKRLLAFAPSYKNFSELNTEDILKKINNRKKLLPIPGVKKEVNNISKIFHGDVFQDSLATESNFKKYSKDYDILHLAMHTFIDDKNPMYSKLVFYHDKHSKEDGFLNTYELFNMHLNAELVVLSACNTGSGKLSRGEGIMSLARGFIYAGIPGIVMTLWSVEDRSSEELMSYFYKYLSKGEAKDQALRLAKLYYLKNADQLNAHPHYWAGYVSIGEVKPLHKYRNINIYFIYFLIIAGGVFVLFQIKKKIYNKKTR